MKSQYSSRFVLHARQERPEIEGGKLADATVFTAFGAKKNDSGKVLIAMTTDKQSKCQLCCNSCAPNVQHFLYQLKLILYWYSLNIMSQ